ncbi:MAG TPA: hypothetical protein VGO31_01135 [Microbacteriaceae bacterium]|jgi:hypothetical protein|nr:hypothetical protein [Microbacteriaceae bacterium]
MWIPRSWEELDTAVAARTPEDDALDFKEVRHGSPPDLRDADKDIAAMAIRGGVILYGMREANSVADGITPFPLDKHRETLEMKARAAIWPSVTAEVFAIPDPSTAGSGVLVVHVPASGQAPHMVARRYPARMGTVTDYLSEREVEALYRQRAAVASDPGEDDLWRQFEVGGPEPSRGIGRLRLVIAPLSGAPHPAAPWMQAPLNTAAHAASEKVTDFAFVGDVGGLTHWLPWSIGRWRTGLDGLPDSSAGPPYLMAAFRDPGTLSMQSLIYLQISQQGPFIAWERHFAEHALFGLMLAGSLFRDVRGAPLLRCGLRLDGLDESISWIRSGGGVHTTNLPAIPSGSFESTGLFSTHELADDPRDALRELMGMFWASFLPSDEDVLSGIPWMRK